MRAHLFLYGGPADAAAAVVGVLGDISARTPRPVRAFNYRDLRVGTFPHASAHRREALTGASVARPWRVRGASAFRAGAAGKGHRRVAELEKLMLPAGPGW
eukprot:gene9757-biopygen2854